MTITGEVVSVLDALELPIVDGRVDWDSVTADQLHEVVRGAAQELDSREDNIPTAGGLQRSLKVEETARTLSPLQHRFAGLLPDAVNSPKPRWTLDLPDGKPPC